MYYDVNWISDAAVAMFQFLFLIIHSVPMAATLMMSGSCSWLLMLTEEHIHHSVCKNKKISG